MSRFWHWLTEWVMVPRWFLYAELTAWIAMATLLVSTYV